MKETTKRKSWWQTLDIYFSDPDERWVYVSEKAGRFRFPWSRFMSVRSAKEIGFLP